MTYVERENTINRMAMGLLLDKGQEKICQMSDDEIQKIEGNGLFTADFLQELYRRAKEMTKWDLVDVAEFMYSAYCKDKYKTVAYNAIIEGEILERLGVEEACYELGITEEELDDIMDGNSYLGW